MDMLTPAALPAVALWAALNLLLMLGLALNVTRQRLRVGAGVGTGGDATLERAVRAHGNNAEYVPGALLLMLLLALSGAPALALHCAGALLLLARVLHAIGIQQQRDGVPPARAAGNIITWALYLLLAGWLVGRVLALT